MLKPTEISDTHSSVRIIKVHKTQISDAWPYVKEWLEKSIKVAPPFWKIEDLENLCHKGDYIMWIAIVNGVPRGVVLTDLVQFPSVLVCGCPWIGGNSLSLWLPKIQETIEHWARDAGAKYLTGGGRRGWIKTSGMQEIGIMLVKEL